MLPLIAAAALVAPALAPRRRRPEPVRPAGAPGEEWVAEVDRLVRRSWPVVGLGPKGVRPHVRLSRLLEAGAEWAVATPAAVTVDELAKAAPRLASAVNVAGRLVAACEVSGDGWEGHAVVRLWERDPITIPRPVPWAPGTTPMTSPGGLASIGVHRRGDPAWVPVERTHALVGGQNDSGKSSAVKVLIGNLAPFDSVELTVYDAAKSGLGYGMLAPRVEVVAGFRAVEAGLTAQLARLRRRAERAVELGLDDGVRRFSSACPMVVMVVEEGPALAASKGTVATIAKLVQETRAVGGVVVFVAQNPLATVVDSVLRGELKARYAFRTANPDASRAILGHLPSESEGPHRVPKAAQWQGVSWGDLDGQGAELVRWWHADDAWLAACAQATAGCVPAARW